MSVEQQYLKLQRHYWRTLIRYENKLCPCSTNGKVATFETEYPTEVLRLTQGYGVTEVRDSGAVYTVRLNYMKLCNYTQQL